MTITTMGPPTTTRTGRTTRTETITPLTRSQLLANVATTIRSFPHGNFTSLRDVEYDLKKLMATPIGGTILEQVATAAEANGVKIGDPGVAVGDKTVGDIMRSDLSLTQTEVNALACRCANGDSLTPTQAAANLDALASKAAG